MCHNRLIGKNISYKCLLSLLKKGKVYTLRRSSYHNNIVHYLRFLGYTLDPTKIRPQDVPAVIQEMSRNPGGRLPAWHMVRQHWSQITELFGHGSFTMGAIIRAVTSGFTSTFDLGEVSSPVIWSLVLFFCIPIIDKIK